MKKLLLTALAAMAAIMAYAQTDIKVEVHNVVALDENFNVTFIVEGEETPKDFSWSAGDGFQVLWGPQQGHSTSIQIINGQRKTSAQTTYTYVLKPKSAGKFVLPLATARIKGNVISSKAVNIEVLGAGASSQKSPAQQSGQAQGNRPQPRQQQGVSDEDIFLTMTVDRNNVVVGEPVIATIKLYQKTNVVGFESAEFPSFNGFWSQEIEAPSSIEFVRETYEGQIYNVALLRRFILIPQQKGSVTIEPAELVCMLNVRVPSRGPSIFDGFFDDYRTIKKKVSSKALTVNVSALPSGAPASFAGGVGDFNITAKLSKDTLKTHEAASLILTVSGRGNISLLEAPKVSFPPDMEVYDTKISDKIDRNGLSGSKTYEFPFIPRSYGDFVIDPVKYSYYDVNTKRYVTLETQPIELTVEKGKDDDASGAVVVSGINRKDVKTLGSDIRFINTKSSSLVPKGQFFVGSAGFWAAVVLLMVFAVACWAAFRKIAVRRADVVGTRNRKATKMALKRLHLAGTFLNQNLYTAFYEELHKALLGFISDKLNMPLADLSKDRISEALLAAEVEKSRVDTFIGLLDACEFARYAPDAGHEAMAAHYNSALEVISSIDSNMKARKNSAKPVMMLMLLMTVMPMSMQAADSYVDSLWNAANQAYSEGRWNDAAGDYQMLSIMGLESAALYCNTGDAFFKEGNLPKAILYYEKALKLDPSYEDARYNLELLNARIQDRIEFVPEFILKVWAKDVCWLMDSDAWAVAFLVFLGLTLAMLLLFLLAPSVAGRRTGFFTGIVMLILAIAAISFSVWQKNDYFKADDAIVMRPVSAVKSSPSAESSQDLFVLHEGTKVRILDQVGSWNNIELSDGRQGWIPSGDIEVI